MKTPNIVKVDKNGRLKLTAFKDLLDISEVSFYKIKEHKVKPGETPSLTIKFYDKNRKLIKITK